MQPMRSSYNTPCSKY